MFATKTYIKVLTRSFIIIFAVLTSTACLHGYAKNEMGDDQYLSPTYLNGKSILSSKKIEITVKGRKSSITFAEPAQLGDPQIPIVKDESGKIIRPCILCSKALQQKFGTNCKLANTQQLNICRNLVGATTQERHTIIIDVTDVCGTTEIDGWRYPAC